MHFQKVQINISLLIKKKKKKKKKKEISVVNICLLYRNNKTKQNKLY